ncbi:MAG: hypothetical protein KAH21_05120, partial [Spirochaetaceae bacterium]|nr:hypothetical protein [Spirochaetaceae bacterium]
MKWDKLKDISLKLQKRWDRGIYLKSYVKKEALFPLWCPLKGPTSPQMNSNFDEARTWAAGIYKEAEKHHITIVMRDVNHRQLGKNSIPRGFFLENIDSLAVFLGKKNELRIFISSLNRLVSVYPELREWAAAHPLDLIKSEPVLEKLLSIL